MIKLELDNNKRLFLISDTHFCHERIIGYTNRLFENAQIMTETLINNWNSVVNDDDQIIFLGDLLMGTDNPIKKSEYIFECLNGIKYFIIGNHDIGKMSRKLPWYDGPLEIEYRGTKAILQHYPYKKEELKDGYKHYHGHTHGHHMIDENINIINVSCEAINYTPILFEECLEG